MQRYAKHYSRKIKTLLFNTNLAQKEVSMLPTKITRQALRGELAHVLLDKPKK